MVLFWIFLEKRFSCRFFTTEKFPPWFYTAILITPYYSQPQVTNITNSRITIKRQVAYQINIIIAASHREVFMINRVYWCILVVTAINRLRKGLLYVSLYASVFTYGNATARAGRIYPAATAGPRIPCQLGKDVCVPLTKDLCGPFSSPDPCVPIFVCTDRSRDVHAPCGSRAKNFYNGTRILLCRRRTIVSMDPDEFRPRLVT